ncbi:MAG: CRISPR-associated protein [[Ruminococcus] lactaris]
MSWRTIVITKRAKLDLQLGFMVVRGEHTTKVALNEIAVVLIESTAVSLTTSLLAELTKRKVKVIFCDEKEIRHQNWSAIMEVMIPVIRFVSRLRGDKIQKKLSRTEIVSEKIRKQKEF